MLNGRTRGIRWAISIFIIAIAGFAQPATSRGQSCEYWVAPPPRGSDQNPGSSASPWATLEHAANSVADGNCTVWFEDGTYSGEQRVERRFATPTTFKAINPYRARFENNDTTVNINGARNLIFEGFEFSHSGPESGDLVVAVHSDDGIVWAEDIIFRNNVFHDSYNNDLLKPYDGVRLLTVEGNIFYNQGAGEQHMDVNSVTDVVIRNNIFFNDYAGSGRLTPDDAKHFIIVKDSGGGTDGLLGSERVTVDGNIFFNRSGAQTFFIRLGLDGQPYHEAKWVQVVNNLFLGNSPTPVRSVLGISGARDITFANNSVVGDLPARAAAFVVERKGENPPSENLSFYNNIWSDPTGTMGMLGEGDKPLFSDGDADSLANLTLVNNLYWNAGQGLPAGKLAGPTDDPLRVVGNPGINSSQGEIVLPRLERLLSEGLTIREEFVRLVRQYGSLPPGSAATGQAEASQVPGHDILGRPRSQPYDLGAFEAGPSLRGHADLTEIQLQWVNAHEPGATQIVIEYSANDSLTTVELPPTASSYTLTGLRRDTLYEVTLYLRDAQGQILASSNRLWLITSDIHVVLPVTPKDSG